MADRITWAGIGAILALLVGSCALLADRPTLLRRLATLEQRVATPVVCTRRAPWQRMTCR